MVQGRARTGRFDTPNAIAKFVVMAHLNKNLKCQDRTRHYKLSDDVLKHLEHERHHNELASHSRPSILGFSQGSVCIWFWPTHVCAPCVE